MVIKITELIDICINLFGPDESFEPICKKYMDDFYYFPNNSSVGLNRLLTYTYYRNDVTKSFETTNLYEMIEHLKKEHANLLLPIKIARMK